MFTRSPGGDRVGRDPIGPVTQQDFNAVLDAGEYDRISVGWAILDDAGTGLFTGGVSTQLEGERIVLLVHMADTPHFGFYEGHHMLEYWVNLSDVTDVVALLNLMRQKNFFNLNVTRDPNGGPDRFNIGAQIRYGGDTKESDISTNVRDTSTPDNAAFFEILDFIRERFVNYGLNNWTCKVEWWRDEQGIGQQRQYGNCNPGGI
jgi:hypothetical protein